MAHQFWALMVRGIGGGGTKGDMRGEGGLVALG